MKFSVANVTLVTFRASFFGLMCFHVSSQIISISRCVFTQWAFVISAFDVNAWNVLIQSLLIRVWICEILFLLKLCRQIIDLKPSLRCTCKIAKITFEFSFAHFAGLFICLYWIILGACKIKRQESVSQWCGTQLYWIGHTCRTVTQWPGTKMRTHAIVRIS